MEEPVIMTKLITGLEIHITHFPKAQRPVRLLFHRPEHVGSVPELTYKTIVIRARHPYINIIIPWDESLMPHRTQKGSPGQEITDTLFIAKTRYRL